MEMTSSNSWILVRLKYTNHNYWSIILRVSLYFVVAVIKMEGGTDNDLLSLDQTFSSENGDKAGEGEEEKRGKDKNSESRNRSWSLAMGWFYSTLCG